MFADISQPPPPLPTPDLKTLRPGVSLLPPLSRRGIGPGLIILTRDSENLLDTRQGVPSSPIKWAEEGYTVVQIDEATLSDESAQRVLEEAAEALRGCDKCEAGGNIGLAAYSAALWNKAVPAFKSLPNLVAGIVYANASELDTLASVELPTLQHIAGSRNPTTSSDTYSLVQHYYPKAASYAFATPFHPDFHYATESRSHTRSLQFLKPRMGGPYFDLERIWEEHTYYEFADRSVEHTMSTMVQEPYVNHVPTLTGGIGREKLSNFYAHDFIFNNSADTDLELISRTVGIDRVVDEFIFKFTHDRQVDWLLPGVPPTNLKAEVPFTAVVNIRGDRLYHEHISWDQGTVLRQLGLMPEYLPFPHPVPDGWGGAGSGVTFEYRVPVAGRDTAEKMRDRTAVPSNEMLEFRIRERKDET